MDTELVHQDDQRAGVVLNPQFFQVVCKVWSSDSLVVDVKALDSLLSRHGYDHRLVPLVNPFLVHMQVCSLAAVVFALEGPFGEVDLVKIKLFSLFLFGLFQFS